MKQTALLVALLILVIAIMFASFRETVGPTVSGEDCPDFDTTAPITSEAFECWNRLATVGVFICPPEAHPDWLTAVAPHCPH